MGKKIRIEKDGNFVRIGTKWYAFRANDDGDFRTGDHVLVEIDKKRYDKRVDAITERLFSFVNPKLVMKDALKDMMEEELIQLERHIKKCKGKLKVTTRKHCIQMEVGGVKIPIR
jgi:hypothetical protein